MIGHIFLTAKMGVLKITPNCISFLVLYTFVSVMRLENVLGFEFFPRCLTFVRVAPFFLSLKSDFLLALWWFLGRKVGVGI